VSDLELDNGRMPATHFLGRVWGFVKGQLVQPVPEVDAHCEYNCRVGQCTMGEWQTCESRLRTLARKSILGETAEQPPVD